MGADPGDVPRAALRPGRHVLLVAALTAGPAWRGIAVFALAGLGCSALLPLTISFGQAQLATMATAAAGAIIACYQVGYGLAAFGVGPLLDAGHSLVQHLPRDRRGRRRHGPRLVRGRPPRHRCASTRPTGRRTGGIDEPTPPSWRRGSRPRELSTSCGTGTSGPPSVEVGGAVRAYAVGGRDVLEPFDVAAMADGAHGAVLAPWPNRLADGRYTFDGVEHRLAVTEPATGCAIHGLLRWAAWRAERHDEASVTMAARLHPQPGYPFDLLVEVTYALDDDGLTVTTRATNVGDRACPYGTGQHPYLSAGGGTLDDCTAVLPAATRITTDPQRQLPTGAEPVDGTPYDLRGGGSLEGLRLDDAFTDLSGTPTASLGPA